MKRLLLFASLIIGIYSCSYENNLIPIESLVPKTKPLEIITRTLTSQSTNFVQIFREGSQIGLHITSGEVGNIYKNTDEYKNIKAEAYAQEGKLHWRQEPEVILQMEPVFIYAYAPYLPDAGFDATHIPVKINPDASQTENYMYGKQAMGQKNINSISPVAWLNMNYALTQVSFQISQTTTNRIYTVRKVQLSNKAGGTTLFSEGTMHIATGAITGTPGCHAATSLSLSAPIQLQTEFSTPVSLHVIPTENTMANGDLEASFTMNDQIYIFRIPAMPGWKKGYTYSYRLLFNGDSLQLKEVITSNWAPGKRIVL